MNKWYRLGQAFAKKYSDGELFKFLSENNYINGISGNGKDFKEKDYTKMCVLVGIEEEEENEHYTYGERKYCFYWGFDTEKQK